MEFKLGVPAIRNHPRSQCSCGFRGIFRDDEEGAEELLAQAINVAVELKLFKAQELIRVIVGGTVQHKAIAASNSSGLHQQGQGPNALRVLGVKVGVASTFKGNLIVGARAFHGNPYDGHTLSEQLEQATILMQDRGSKPATAFVDLGYRGVDAENPNVHIVHRGKAKRISEQERHQLRRRQAIEPIIGHLKADHRMDRCYLKGERGDRLHAVLCAAGFNIKWLLRMIVRKGVSFRRVIFLCLQQAPSQGRSWLGSVIAQTPTTANSWRPTRRPHAIFRWLAIDVLAAA